MTAGKEYLLKLSTKRIPAVVKKINYKVDVNTGEHIETAEIFKNEIADCEIEFAENIVADKFKNIKTLGAFILIDRISNMTSACGVVNEINTLSDSKPYFAKGDIKARGVVFEEFYFNLENAFVKKQDNDKSYTVGDAVTVNGDSFRYPSDFDIVIPEDNTAVLVRDEKISDIINLNDYAFSFIPKVDSRGFALKINSEEELNDFINDYENAPSDKKAQVFNKWAKFETYRRIVCNDNFWII